MAFASHPRRPSMIDVRTRVVPAIADSWRVPDSTRRLAGAARHIRIRLELIGQIRSGSGEVAQELRSFALTQIVKDAVGSRCMERRGAGFLTPEMVAFGRLQTCGHPQSRNVLKIVKKCGREGQDNEPRSTRFP